MLLDFLDQIIHRSGLGSQNGGNRLSELARPRVEAPFGRDKAFHPGVYGGVDVKDLAVGLGMWDGEDDNVLAGECIGQGLDGSQVRLSDLDTIRIGRCRILASNCCNLEASIEESPDYGRA